MAQAQHISSKDIASVLLQDSSYERHTWDLIFLLTDLFESESISNKPDLDMAEFYSRARKDRFSRFWEQLCQDAAENDVAAAPNAEERALAYLSANKVVEACDALAQGRNFRLAILVAQLGGDRLMREDMAAQIHEWRELNVLSEMTEPIRALYGLLAGNTCICEGKKGALEDRARTFTISDRFNLDWKRTFGLRLWYAILAEEPIEAAVKTFAEDLTNDESKKPVPWFIEQSSANRPWNDPAGPQRVDLLWGILKLYASSGGALQPISIADIVLPHNVTGNPLDFRLSFQLYHSLALRFPRSADATKADHLASDFATQLDAAGEWLWAVFALLHLSDREQRQRALQDILAHHAAKIAGPSSPAFRTLTTEFKIPAAWIWEAKALHARSVLQDHAKEVHYLLQAANWEAAHETMIHSVAPRCVVEQDHTTLQGLLNGFGKGKDQLDEWPAGGQVYADYLSLVSGIQGAEKSAALRRMVSTLPSFGEGQGSARGMGEEGFLEKVAVKEMGGLVAGMVSGEAGAKMVRFFFCVFLYIHTLRIRMGCCRTGRLINQSHTGHRTFSNPALAAYP